MRKLRLLACLIGLLVGGTVSSFGKDMYVAQTSAGANNGADCADAYSASWFNSATNWGSGGAQISPGDTVHLCGTFSSALNVQASGASGSPTTILFENSAKLSLPYCPTSGCLGLSDYDNLTVDGGANGIIENTANGSLLGNKQTSHAIDGGSVGNIEIKNLTIRNIYVHSGTDNSSAAELSYSIFLEATQNNIKIHNNTISESHTGVTLYQNSAGTSGNWEVYNNTISQQVWGIDVASAQGTISGVSVHDNEVFDTDHWWQADDNWHIDPIFVRAPAGHYGNVYIYNNYIHGSMAHITGLIFLSQYSNAPTYVFNNVFHPTSTSSDSYNWTAQGDIAMQWNGTNNYYVYNNTFDGTTVFGIGNGAGTTRSTSGPTAVNSFEWKNNIHLNLGGHWENSTFVSDYNNWYNVTAAGNSAFVTGGSPTYYSYSGWQGLGADVHSLTSNPLVNTDYTLQATSPVRGAGTNLYSVCNGQPVPGLGALCFDKAGVARPSSGAWDMGAYQYSSVPAPTKLSNTVK